ncbi:MAG: YraN family protein [Opitutaceae bacterium]|nr:YraN family protein [Cytophagales bacterium]
MNNEQYNFKTTEAGKKGEILASIYLENKGFEIIDSNYRYKRAEIDLIATHQKLLIFIEVKLRTNLLFGLPETFVSTSKQKRIKMAAENYIFEKNWLHDIRFDIVSIVNRKGVVVIEHFMDSF